MKRYRAFIFIFIFLSSLFFPKDSLAQGTHGCEHDILNDCWPDDIECVDPFGINSDYCSQWNDEPDEECGQAPRTPCVDLCDLYHYPEYEDQCGDGSPGHCPIGYKCPESDEDFPICVDDFLCAPVDNPGWHCIPDTDPPTCGFMSHAECEEVGECFSGQDNCNVFCSGGLPGPEPGYTFMPETCGCDYCEHEHFWYDDCIQWCTNYPAIKTAFGCIPTHPLSFIEQFEDILIGIGSGIALLLMIIGAFFVLTSQGQPERVKRGKEVFTGGVIGLIFMIFAVFIYELISVDILGILK